MQNWLTASRERIEQDLARSPQRRFFSPAYLAQYQTVLPLLRHYIHGQVIDLGCGTMPFQDFLAGKVTVYHTLDLRPRSEKTTYVGDVQEMHMVGDASYDSIICLEVLEHVAAPTRAIQEMYRILRPDGVIILSVPHLSRLHERPHDYYRFTKYGLRHLFENAGFAVLDIQEKGGLFSFLGHQVSTLLLSAAWPAPGLRQVAWFLNKWFITRPCHGLDRATGSSGILALGYVGVARKPS